MRPNFLPRKRLWTQSPGPRTGSAPVSGQVPELQAAGSVQSLQSPENPEPYPSLYTAQDLERLQTRRLEEQLVDGQDHEPWDDFSIMNIGDTPFVHSESDLTNALEAFQKTDFDESTVTPPVEKFPVAPKPNAEPSIWDQGRVYRHK